MLLKASKQGIANQKDTIAWLLYMWKHNVFSIGSLIDSDQMSRKLRDTWVGVFCGGFLIYFDIIIAIDEA